VDIFAENGPPTVWVDLYINGKFFKALPPYGVTWNSATVSNGSHTISAAALDRSDQNVGTDSVTINVENP
jgi:hypothetical protein